MTAHALYDTGFLTRVERTAGESAAVLVEILMQMFAPRSVLDVGCGTGSWLRAFLDHGVDRVQGVDGGWVPRERLRFPPEQFRHVDLSREMPKATGYDLALCLEVAEHLPREMAPRLVEALTAAAPVVVFSAAIPGQAGTEHINLQWPSYWRALFARHRYVCVDALRPRLWCDERVDWVYRQNVYVLMSEEAYREHPELVQYRIKTRSPILTVIDERIAEAHAALDSHSISALLSAMLTKAMRHIGIRRGGEATERSSDAGGFRK